MAKQPITVTPAKKGASYVGMISAARNTAASAKMHGANSNAANLQAFLTPHKPSANIEDSDTDDDGYAGGGAKLTPQPRGVKSEKTRRCHDYAEHSEQRGGASLSAPRYKAMPLDLFSPSTELWGESVARATVAPNEPETKSDNGLETQSDDDIQSSSDGAGTVATSNKTAATGTSDATQCSSPNTIMSQAYSTTTPKPTGWTGSEATQFVQTAPAHFAPRPDSRTLTNAPPPSFDLPANASNLVGQVIANARATQSTPASANSAAAGHSPGLVISEVTQDVFQADAAQVSHFMAGSTLVQRASNNADGFRHNAFSSPGSVTSSMTHRDSLGSVTGVSPGQLQRRPGICHIDWQQLIAETREEFSKLVLPQLNDQPATFNTAIPASDMLNMLTSGFTTRPPFDLATLPDFEPFVQSALTANQPTFPVVKIDELPYEAKMSDVIAFLGGNAKILNDADEPVHIMLERITAKTGPAYIEFYDFESAMKVVDKHHQSKAHGKPVRIGSRIVTVSIASQDQLLRDLFPYAREVNWIAGQPHIQVPPEKFKGFVTEEELISLVKNVEFPHRVPYTKACPQRSVETMISIIRKLPWHMAAYITIRQQYRIYKAAVDMIQILQLTIYNSDHHRRPAYLAPGVMAGDCMRISELLNEKLLKRLVRAAMGCPGFSPLLKDNIAFISSLDERQMMEYGVPAHANRWRHMYALVPNPALPADVIDYFICLIREETTRMVDALPATLRRRARAKGAETDAYWGFFWLLAGFPDAAGDALDGTTLQQAADLELGAVDAVLARALPGRGHAARAGR